MSKYRPIIVAHLALLVIGALLVLVAAESHAAELREGHRLIVFQCDRADHGIRDNCETYIIPAHPKVGELGEATATHRYEVEICRLSKRGYANDCDVRFIPKGDQIIAPAH